jgi:two-component sensor histidine kinase/DNA-binding response OmpR family regulator
VPALAATSRVKSSSDDERINILIVDDEPRNLMVLELILDDPAYHLVRAETADQALLALLADHFALLILDISMPGVTGFELAKMIKERKKTSRVPIIFLTAYYNDDQHVMQGYGAGAVDYLHKPVNPDILRSKVAVFAELHRMQRQLAATNEALVAEVAERRQAQERLHALNVTLEERVAERTQAVRSSAALLQAVTDNASVGLARFDRQQRYLFANPAYCRIFNLPQDISGERASGVLGEAYRDVAPALERSFGGERMTGELSLPGYGEGSARCHYSVVYAPEHESDEIVSVVVAMFDITERKRSEEHIRLLLAEINHRAKNTLTLVSSIARHTSAHSKKDYFARFSDRIHALAASHDLLAKNEWRSIPVAALVRAQLAHFEDLMDKRIVVSGASLDLSVVGAQTLGMVLHELSTNAAKYGALANDTGRIEIVWGVDRDSELFVVSWTEHGVGCVSLPTEQGFGSMVMKTIAELSLEGNVTVDFAPNGLRWHLTCPVNRILKDYRDGCEGSGFGP